MGKNTLFVAQRKNHFKLKQREFLEFGCPSLTQRETSTYKHLCINGEKLGLRGNRPKFGQHHV